MLTLDANRATGSDGYTNERVTAFNDHFMTPDGVEDSKVACSDVHVEACSVFRGDDEDDPLSTECMRMGNCDDEVRLLNLDAPR